MKYSLPIAGVALALSLTSATAYAADHQRGDHRGNRDAITQNQGGNDRFERRRDRNRGDQQQNLEQRKWQPNANNNRGNWQNNNRQHQPTVNNNWRNDRVRTSFDQFRRNFQSPHQFRTGAYHGPRDHHYRRWSFGERLPYVYLNRSYWLANVFFYGLFAPPPGLIWMRYGPDALLVDQYTGEIVQVRYGVFY